MASEKLFAEIPPFPDDVPEASLSTISLASLRRLDDKTGQEHLLNAAQKVGFFLLDLRGDEMGEATVGEIDQLFHIGKEVMNLPQHVKQDCLVDITKDSLGFKPIGQSKTETNEHDRFEWFNLGQDGLMGTSPLQPLPPLVKSHLALFTSFLKHGQEVAAVITSALEKQLGLAEGTLISPPDKPSGSVVRIARMPASLQDEDLRTSMIHHTDFGTMTLLANVVGGLQILLPGRAIADKTAWQWVRPRPGCLIVDIGDALVQWTGGLLRSNVHRVSHAPGQQRYVDRYSLVIAFRPEREASMAKRVAGGQEEDDEAKHLTAWEWEVKKYVALMKEFTMPERIGGSKEIADELRASAGLQKGAVVSCE